MNIRELINELEEIASEQDDQVEVRLAIQPDYPFEHAIGGLKLVNPHQEEYDDLLAISNDPDLEEDEREKLVEQMNEIFNQGQDAQILYIRESSQIGYISKDVWDD